MEDAATMDALHSLARFPSFFTSLLRIPAAALRDNYWKHLATSKNFDRNFFELEHYIQSPRFLLFDDSISGTILPYFVNN